ncbi:unnamed protein product [Cylicocyclus nassatus]|uniref:Uncharacterized protein n=1 Tax=Cylicocyclus nassatus TaxID=53992 RepID=A0AA36M941_CYLNA|nr:unnamed protein product [Cylicocyclus nassatus]
MFRIIAAVLLYFSTSFADENVKNATAEGNYYHEYLTYGDYKPPPHYGGYNFGIYGYRRPYDRLINSHVCSLEATYAVYSYPGTKRGRPHILDCSSGFYDFQKRLLQQDDKYTQDSCDRCCKQAARLDNMVESEILGLTLVIDRKVKCACCAPHRPYMDVIKVPVQHPNYQPYGSPPPPPPPVYGQPVYVKN